ncbi:hypothetical protein [Olsenella sp. DNF00959]|uniref:hypothetical protein n=1 Tax=Olsenella sp. DNF00959 TaxID=1476999 RepID=UPI0007867DDE|nr:hypothetical protein [Olsenella sp. DNF00959]KXB63745.1 hypothetical protein HMPREF1868_00255 [Olsenella sp. DNF00959]
MAQLSLYVNDATLEGLRSEATREHVSISKLVGGILRERQLMSGWPSGYFDLYGSLPDFPAEDDESLDASLDEACDWFEA